MVCVSVIEFVRPDFKQVADWRITVQWNLPQL